MNILDGKWGSLFLIAQGVIFVIWGLLQLKYGDYFVECLEYTPKSAFLMFALKSEFSMLLEILISCELPLLGGWGGIALFGLASILKFQNYPSIM